MAKTSVLKSKPFWVGVLYFAEGFPLGVFYEILPVHFRMQGIDLTENLEHQVPVGSGSRPLRVWAR